jgi:hypothetical protein
MELSLSSIFGGTAFKSSHVRVNAVLQFSTAAGRKWTGAFITRFAAAIIPCLLGFSGQAATYYVATNGIDSNLGTLAFPFQTMHKAATVMTNGDVLYIRGGFYNCTNSSIAWQFDPKANSLTVSNYPGETPVFGNFQPAYTIPELFSIYNRTNIKIFGMTATNCARTCHLISSTNCEIGYCTFAYSPTNFGAPLIYIHNNAPSNWVHHCTLHDVRVVTTPQTDQGEIIWIGGNSDYVDDFSFANRIENCEAWNGGHSTIEIRAPMTIVRSNYFHNAPWIWWNDYQQLGGHREIDTEPAATNCVIEWNRCAYAGQPIANNGANGIEISSAGNIIRFNTVIWNQNGGIVIATKDPWPWVADNNHIYQNTIAWNGRGQWWVTNYTLSTYGYADKCAVKFAQGYGVGSTNDVFVNNVLAYNQGINVNAKPPGGTVITNWIRLYVGTTPRILKNWINNVNGDPLFMNISDTNRVFSGGVTVLGDPIDATTLNLSLQATSPCIDAGQFLTTITNSSGSGTSFNVADPGFFYNGYGVVPGDQIQLQGQTVRARILTVNYATGQITVEASLTWTQGQGVALAYSGAAPDMGAYEYASVLIDPAIVIRPSSIDLGTVAVGTTTNLSFNVQNIGGGILSGSAIIAVPFTTVSGGTYSLVAGQSQLMTVGYTAPSTPSTNTQSIIFTGGGGAIGTVSATARPSPWPPANLRTVGKS